MWISFASHNVNAVRLFSSYITYEVCPIRIRPVYISARQTVPATSDGMSLNRNPSRTPWVKHLQVGCLDSRAACFYFQFIFGVCRKFALLKIKDQIIEFESSFALISKGVVQTIEFMWTSVLD